jgi:hypothetical protein
MEMVEKMGSRIEALLYSVHLEKLNVLRECDTNAFNLATGYCLDHIFQHCTDLTRLRPMKLQNTLRMMVGRP